MDRKPFTAIAARTLPRSKKVASAVGGALFAVPMILMAALNPGIAAARIFGDGGFMGAILGSLGFFFAWALTREKEAQAELRVKGDVLEHGGVPIANRRDVDEGHAWEASDGAHVQLGKGRRGVHLRLARIEDARAALAEMGVDASKKAASFRIMSPTRNHHRVRLGLMLVALPISLVLGAVMHRVTNAAAHPVLFLFPYLLAAGAVLIPGRIRIGADGIVLQWLWQQRFVPLEEIEGVSATERSFLGRVNLGLKIALRGGEILEVGVAAPNRVPAAVEGGRADVQTILERIEEAREVARGLGGVDAARVLGREGRTAIDWLAALRETFGATEGFRSGAPLTNQELWRTIEDPGARPWVRAAAAAALAANLGADDRSRLRVAAEASAAPKLRVALDAAASADDARLTEALESIEQDEHAERA